MSCDSMVALGSATTDGKVLFAKNSDRPEDEIQTFVYVPKKKHGADAKLRCTHITIPQVAETFECALSQPLWMWGAEMGFNEHSVVIGNEAVWTKEGDGPAALLGMDLVRLGLERSKTAKQALDVITKLLETHGQGGPCGQHDKTWSYNNSFLLADPTEAWVLETAGKWWVAERVRDGVRSISNALSIHTKFDLCSKGIQDHAKSRGYWDGKESFDFAKAFAAEDSGPDDEESRELRVKKMLAHGCAHGRKISARTLINILRDHEAGVCMHGAFASTAALVSHLSTTAIHYITATAAPCESFFKPIKMTEISTLPADSWTEDNLKEEKERKRVTGSSHSEELLLARLAAEEALNETENRDLVLTKLQRQIHALEAKYLTVTEGPAPTSDKKKDVEPTPPLSPTAASIPSDKLFITAVSEELELYRKIIPPPTAAPIPEETADDVEGHEGGGTDASTTSAAASASSSATTTASSAAATAAATATTPSPSTTSAS